MLADSISQDLIAFNAAEDVEVPSARADGGKRIIPPDREVVRVGFVPDVLASQTAEVV
jgi:hypothetical protein